MHISWTACARKVGGLAQVARTGKQIGPSMFFDTV